MEDVPAGGFHTLKSETWPIIVDISCLASFPLFSSFSGVEDAASQSGCNDISSVA